MTVDNDQFLDIIAALNRAHSAVSRSDVNGAERWLKLVERLIRVERLTIAFLVEEDTRERETAERAALELAAENDWRKRPTGTG